jgi:hypothetical protein
LVTGLLVTGRLVTGRFVGGPVYTIKYNLGDYLKAFMESVVKHGHLLLKGGVISFMGGLFKCFYRAIKVLFFLCQNLKHN